MIYGPLSLLFLAAAAVVAVLALVRATTRASGGSARSLLHRWLPAAAIAFFASVVLTSVFDSVLIALDIIRYDTALISGLRVGLAPIEDFSYPLAAVLLVPSLWSLLSPRRATPPPRATPPTLATPATMVTQDRGATAHQSVRSGGPERTSREVQR